MPNESGWKWCRCGEEIQTIEFGKGLQRKLCPRCNRDEFPYKERKYLMIDGQGTRATKHNGSAVLLRKILKEVKEMNVLMAELKELLNGKTEDK